MTRPTEKLVYDRTETDILEARKIHKIFYEKGWSALTPEQQNKWTHGLRGCLNAEDLNRISAWCSYLTDLYRSMFPYISMPRYLAKDWNRVLLINRTDISDMTSAIIRLATNVENSFGVSTEKNRLNPDAEKVTLRWLNDMEYVLSLCIKALDTH